MKVFFKIVTLSFALLFCVSCNLKNNSSIISDESELPEDADKIIITKSEGIYNNFNDWQELGYKNGEKVNDITLYTSDGKKFNLYNELENGKPVLLISGSYSCGPSQRNLNHVDELEQKFTNELTIYFVQIVEAHPIDTVSPYSEINEKWVIKGRYKSKIQTSQPKTYGDRKSLAKLWIEECSIETTVLLDSRNNSFWIEYGQAPNMAYLIHPDGTVYFKQIWFSMEEMNQKIKELLVELNSRQT